MESDFLAQFPAKTAEYLLALSYLVSFVYFWRYISKEPQPAAAPATRSRHSDFAVPANVLLHPGHAWLRMDGEVATAGIDDFAQRLVGPVSQVELPEEGATLVQGQPAWQLTVDGRQISMVSPVDGTVVAVNPRLAHEATTLRDPYGEGWLVKVRPTRAHDQSVPLVRGDGARQFMQDAFEALLRRASPQLGPVAHDGGAPIHGFARALDPDKWDELAREHFLTGGSR